MLWLNQSPMDWRTQAGRLERMFFNEVGKGRRWLLALKRFINLTFE